VDPLWLAYGAIAGLITGLLWGRFDLGGGSGTRTLPTTFAALVLLIVTELLLDQVKPAVPTQFWLALLVVAWFVEPIGRRLRERAR
jgi:hypothetical protein